MNISNKYLRKFENIKIRSALKAIDYRFLRGYSDYQKFIILGQGRTGSNMLATALRKQRSMITYGEIFNNNHHDRILWEYPGFGHMRESAGALSIRENDPIDFLNTHVFRKFPGFISAVGFKVFYYHALEDNWNTVWQYLARIPGLRIIHMKRKNILKTHLSLKKSALDKKMVCQV